MPYRRLPTTDKARLRAIEAATHKASEKKTNELAFSKNTLFELKIIESTFKNHLIQYEFDQNKEAQNIKEYKTAMEKARLYVSHFIKVLYMNIERQEIKSDTLKFYELQNYNGKIPLLTTEEKLLTWGNKIIKGEQKRIQHGGSPVYNPSIALVKVQVEDFNEAAIFHKNLKKNTLRSYKKMQEVRKKTNEFISEMWSEIENNLQADNQKTKRQLAKDYGIIYIYRKNEKKRLNTEGTQVNLLFDFK